MDPHGNKKCNHPLSSSSTCTSPSIRSLFNVLRLHHRPMPCPPSPSAPSPTLLLILDLHSPPLHHTTHLSSLSLFFLRGRAASTQSAVRKQLLAVGSGDDVSSPASKRLDLVAAALLRPLSSSMVCRQWCLFTITLFPLSSTKEGEDPAKEGRDPAMVLLPAARSSGNAPPAASLRREDSVATFLLAGLDPATALDHVGPFF